MSDRTIKLYFHTVKKLNKQYIYKLTFVAVYSQYRESELCTQRLLLFHLREYLK